MFNAPIKPLVVPENQPASNQNLFDSDIELKDFFEPFILSRRAANCKKATIQFYQWQLSYFFDWLDENECSKIASITSHVIRSYIAERLKTHQQGGVYVSYNAIRTFYLWIWDEYDLESPNPIRKVKCSGRKPEPIPGIPIEKIEQLLKECEKGKTPDRDKAIIAVLIDTGIRRRELVDIQYKDVDLINGSILILRGKNGRSRKVFMGKKTRKLVRKYALTIDKDNKNGSFWLTAAGTPLTIAGVRQILRRIQDRLGFEEHYSFHDFRRCFALEIWRNGADINAVSEMLGHSGIEVTKRYIDASVEDKKRIHALTSPMDMSK